LQDLGCALGAQRLSTYEQVVKYPFVKYWKKNLVSLALLTAVVFMDLAILAGAANSRSGIWTNMQVVLQTPL
jgi:hypothetical protein